MVLFPLTYYHPLISFFIYAITISLVVSSVFFLDEYLSWYIENKPLKEKLKIKVTFHMFVSFIILFVILVTLYYLFGFGTHLFPICSYKKFCKN